MFFCYWLLHKLPYQWWWSLIVSRTRLSTVGDRAFPIAAASVSGTNYHVTSRHVTSAPCQRVFCSRLKTHLYSRSFSVFFRSACQMTSVVSGYVRWFRYSLTYLLIFLLLIIPLSQRANPSTGTVTIGGLQSWKDCDDAELKTHFAGFFFDGFTVHSCVTSNFVLQY